MQLEQAMQRLAQVQERRRGLDEAQRKAALLEERAAALRAERLQPWRPVSTVPGK
jgi:hypothetical protein